jgi:hypothetical protein
VALYASTNWGHQLYSVVSLVRFDFLLQGC